MSYFDPEYPTPHDGDDLEIHLVYEITPVVIEDPAPSNNGSDESEDTPAVSMFSTALVVSLAVAFSQRDRQDRLRRD